MSTNVTPDNTKSSVVAIEVEFDRTALPGMTEEETAEGMAHIMALKKLWCMLRLKGYTAEELLEVTEGQAASHGFHLKAT